MKTTTKSSNEPPASASQAASNAPPAEPLNTPLTAAGVILSRTRRPFNLKKDGKEAIRYQITLMVSRGAETVPVEFWCDTTTIPDKYAKGAEVELPIYIRSYIKNNTPRYRLCIAEPNGEEF